MAVLTIGRRAEAGAGVVLGTAQTGNADTTNTLDRGDHHGPAAVVLTSAIGATPTVTVQILGSVDGVNFFKIAYALVATPETVAVADITVTTAVTTTYLLRPDHAWRFLKLNYAANTNVTLTATAFVR
jgi:hypothetical protein